MTYYKFLVEEKFVGSWFVCFFLYFQIAREHGIRFLETSAKTNINIEQAFYNLAEDILKKQLTKDNEETSQNIHVSNTKDKGGCC